MCRRAVKGAWSGQQGLTLLELVIGMAILAILLPLVGALFFQFLRIPTATEAALDLQNQLRQAGRWLNLDGTRAQSFVLGSEPDYGTFGWHDYTVSPPALYQGRYFFQDGELMREEKMDGVLSGLITVAGNVAAYGDITIKACPTFARFIVTVTAERVTDTISQSQEFFLRLRPEPWGEIAREPLGYALFAGGQETLPPGAIHWSGSDSLVVGNVHSNGDVSVSGSDNRVTDTLTAAGIISVGGQRNIFGSLQQGVPLRPMPINCAVEDFPAPTFSWPGDVNLVNEQQVWEDWPVRTRLKPGVYLAGGRITLGQNNASGTVTFIANHIHVSGSDVALWPFYAGIVALGTGTGNDVIQVSGQRGLWRGMVYAPQGEVDVAGDGFTLYGSMVARLVKLTRQGTRVLHNAY